MTCKLHFGQYYFIFNIVSCWHMFQCPCPPLLRPNRNGNLLISPKIHYFRKIKWDGTSRDCEYFVRFAFVDLCQNGQNNVEYYFHQMDEAPPFFHEKWTIFSENWWLLLPMKYCSMVFFLSLHSFKTNFLFYKQFTIPPLPIVSYNRSLPMLNFYYLFVLIPCRILQCFALSLSTEWIIHIFHSK